MVRSFSGRPPAPDVVDGLLEAALRAPSAGNTGGWSAVVLEGPEQTAPFWEATTTPSWRDRSRRWPGLSRAPLVVVLLADPEAYLERYSAPDKEGSRLDDPTSWPVPYWFVDVGMAAQTLLLGAVDAGLGACFLGNFRGEEALRRVLGAPDHVRYAGSVLIGEPGGEDPPSSSSARGRRSVERVIHRGRW
jgi:nitroreductase